MPESISAAPKRPAPVVLTDDPVDWVFDTGDGARPWVATSLPDLPTLRRVRNPKSKAESRHVPVWAYCTTSGTHLRLESGLEHDLLRELDRQVDVQVLVSQPCRLRLPARRRGRRLEHTPDLLSATKSGTVTVWDARAEDRQDEDFLVKSDLTRRACKDVGWSYEVFAGLSAVRKANLMWLHGFRKPMPFYSASLAELRDLLSWPAAIETVLREDSGAGHLVAAMWHGIWAGAITCDLDVPLTRRSPVQFVETS